MKSIILIIIPFFILSGCELYQQDEYQQYYVVESYLVANQDLPEIWVTKTIPFEETLIQDSVGISNATVIIRLLNSDLSIAEQYKYEHANSGNYKPAESTTVKPNRWYQLHITLSNGDLVEAKTLVPGTFRTVNELQENYLYQSNPEIELVITPSKYPGRQSFYVITTHAQDRSPNNLTPFYQDLVTDKDSWINTYYINSSDIINEKNFATDTAGNIILPISWSAFAFYGQNDIVIHAIDDNLYDFWRFNSMLTHEMVSAPGEIQNIRYHINGGIGIFGSMASDTNRVFIDH